MVRVRLFSAIEGGRRVPVLSGYRTLADFGEKDADGTPVLHGFELRLLDRESLEPGDTARAQLFPFAPQLWPARQVGDRIRIREGRTHVGDAYVDSVQLELAALAQLP